MVQKTCPVCNLRTPVACKKCKNCGFEFKKKPRIVTRPLNSTGHFSPTSYEVYEEEQDYQFNQWLLGPSAKKIRAGEGYDLLTAVDEAAKAAEVKVVRTDNIALTLQVINSRILDQERLWYHLRQHNEQESLSSISSYQEEEESGSSDLFMPTLQTVAPTEPKDVPIQVSVIVDPNKSKNSSNSLLDNNSVFMNGQTGSNEKLIAICNPQFGIRYLSLPPGWKCYDDTQDVGKMSQQHTCVSQRLNSYSSSQGSMDSHSLESGSPKLQNHHPIDMETKSVSSSDCASMTTNSTKSPEAGQNSQEVPSFSWPVPIVQIDPKE